MIRAAFALVVPFARLDVTTTSTGRAPAPYWPVALKRVAGGLWLDRRVRDLLDGLGGPV